MAYFSCVALQGSAADQARISKSASTAFLFMAGEMFIVNGKDITCSTSYTGNLWFDHVSGGLLLWLPAKTLDTLVYFWLDMIVLRIGA